MKARKTHSRLLLILSATGIALVLAACGTTGSDSTQANDVDRAFVAEMIPHHMLAVDMAEIASKQGQHPEVKQLASNILSTQNAEIKQMRKIQGDIGSSGSGGMDGMSGMDMDNMSGGRNMAADAQTMGMAMNEMGMSMSTADLKSARPFDRQFIGMMVPHHAGAIRMARAELRGGENPQLKALAQGIVKAQSSEISRMQHWRTTWSGPVSGGASGRDSHMSERDQMSVGN